MICKSYTKSGKRCKSYACIGKKKCVFAKPRLTGGTRGIKKQTSSSSGERFLRRQAVGKGTKYGAPYVSFAGYELSKWASQPRAPPTHIRSTLHQKHNIKHKGVDYNQPLRRKGIGKENPTTRAYGYKTDHRTRTRSGTGRVAGGAVTATGKLLPALGAAWVMHDLVSQYYGGPELGARTTGFAGRSARTLTKRTSRAAGGIAYGAKSAV